MENNQQIPSFDVNAALRRGQVLLKDREWEDARALYNQILMAYPESAEGYVGLMLTKAQCSSLGQLTQLWPELYRQEEIQILDALTPEERAAQPDFDGTYPSRVASAQANRENMVRRFNEDKDLKHAMEFGDDRLKEGLDRLREAVLASYDQRIAAAIRDDARERDLVMKRYEQFVENVAKNAAQMSAGTTVPREADTPAADPRQTASQQPMQPQYGQSQQPMQQFTAQPAESGQDVPPEIHGVTSSGTSGKTRVQLMLEKRNKRMKTLRLVSIISLALVAVAIGLAILFTSVLPKARLKKQQQAAYEAAEQLLKDGDKREAAIAFYNLGDNGDARQRAFDLWGEITQRDVVSAGGWHVVLIRSDGSPVARGFDGMGESDVSDWEDAAAVSAGLQHTVFLKTDGTVAARGMNKDDQCEVFAWKDMAAIDAGMYHTVGLKMDGSVVAVGNNQDGRCDVTDWKDIIAVSAGGAHTVGLKSDGTVVAVGDNQDGQCDVSQWTDIVAISAGSDYTLGLKADGTVVATGYFGSDVSSWTDIVQISAGISHVVGRKADGTVVAAGDNFHGPCDVKTWKNIVAVSAGYNYTVGVKKDGTVVFVGMNENGQGDVAKLTGIRTPQR